VIKKVISLVRYLKIMNISPKYINVLFALLYTVKQIHMTILVTNLKLKGTFIQPEPKF